MEVHGATAPLDDNIRSSQNDVDATILTVIVFRGPGSWKQKALWDEYVVNIINNSEEQITFDHAELIDIEGNPQLSGMDPWMLEETSKENWKHYGEAGLSLTMGSLGTAGAAGTLGVFYYLGGSASAGSALAVLPVVVVADVVYVQVKNKKNKELVENEFSRRMIETPVPIPSGESISDSIFLPQTPAPESLTLFFVDENYRTELLFDLKESPLGKFHL